MDKYIKGGMRMLRYAVMLLIMFCWVPDVCASEETVIGVVYEYSRYRFILWRFGSTEKCVECHHADAVYCWCSQYFVGGVRL